MKNVNMSFLDMLCYHFSLEVVLQSMSKNDPTEKQKFEAKIMKRKLSKQKLWSDIEACTTKTDRRENVKFIVTNYKDRFTS